MKNVYRATRPFWSQIDKSEWKIILVATLLVVLVGILGELIVHDFILLRHPTLPSIAVHGGWELVETAAITFLCLLLIRYYKKRSIGCYPSTFLYCFNMPEDSNPDGLRQVVGYSHLKPDPSTGEFLATGASFFWEKGQLNLASRVGFTSTHVRGSKEGDETTCHIRFNIHEIDSIKRTYKHGLLQFRLDKTTNFESRDGQDIYAGYLQSTHMESEIQDVGVRSKGFAVSHAKGDFNEEDIQNTLRKRGNILLFSLQEMLRSPALPTLWEGASEHDYMLTNFWGHRIPTPQSVILNVRLQPFIDRLLTQMLALSGLDESAIANFKSLAESEAIVSRSDTRIAYEFKLKSGLINVKRQWILNEALVRRAETIKGQIEEHLQGDSLLDIGCGNGMVANLIKGHFSEVLLLDVVEYLPKQSGLKFRLYKEGDQLPIDKGQFDTVLLITVLHHSNNPVDLLKLAWAATRKRLIIIESVVGIHSLEPHVAYELVNSSDENQIGYAAFIDWFYNRVLHDDVPVPYNFTTPEKWISVFAGQHMKVSQTVHLGQDIDIGPEYHILFVLDKELS